MNFDRELAFSYQTTVTVDGYSSNVELGLDGTGCGVPLFIVIMVSEKGGSDDTLDITVCNNSATDPTTSNSVGVLPQITANGLYHFSLPQNAKSFSRLHYNVGGTTHSWKITAFITTLI